MNRRTPLKEIYKELWRSVANNKTHDFLKAVIHLNDKVKSMNRKVFIGRWK